MSLYCSSNVVLTWYLRAAILPRLGPDAYILLSREGTLPAKTYHNTSSSVKVCQIRKQQRDGWASLEALRFNKEEIYSQPKRTPPITRADPSV